MRINSSPRPPGLISQPRPRVFVSSVVEGFEDYRLAARMAIAAAGGEPVLVNEDFPSINASSRNACLDAVGSSDIFVLVIGTRGGWQTPSGRLVIEEELEEARKRRLPTIVFIEDVQQDEDAKSLSRAVSDYVDGYFRVRFRGPDGLRSELARALPPLIEVSQRPTMTQDEISRCFERPYKVGDETSLRFVLTPERIEEVIDPMRLGSPEFIDRLLEIGHSRSIRVFSYERAKDPPLLADDALVLVQPPGTDWRRGVRAARVELSESGVLVVDSNVTGLRERENSRDVMGTFQIAIEDVETALSTDFLFATAVYDEIDTYKRHQRFFWNAALSNLGYRTFARNPQPQRSYTMNTVQRAEPNIAFPSARPIDRIGLAMPARDIERALYTWTK